jgi:hypothetical protein
MVEHPKIKLSLLREIGWSRWDPIGLSQMGHDDWKDGGPCADEYDSYLLGVVGRLRRGEATCAAVSYLEEIEIEHLGGGRNSTTRPRAEATVAAIADYLKGFPYGRLKVRNGSQADISVHPRSEHPATAPVSARPERQLWVV